MAADMSLGRAVLFLSTDDRQFSPGVTGANQKVGLFQKGVEGVKGSVSALGPMIAGAFAVGAIVAGAKALIDYGGNLTDVAAKLGISTDAVQEWEAHFGAAGVSLESVAKAAEQLSIRVIGGDKSAVAALQKMGFTVAELKAMNPEERFNKVADAIGSIQDAGERLYASKAILGRDGTQLLAGLDGHLEENIQRMRDLGLVIDNETLVAADTFGDQIGFLGKQLMAIGLSILGPLLPVLSQLANLLMWLGANVIGPVLNVAVKGAITLLTAFWQTLSGLLSKVAELGAYLPGIGGKFQDLATWLKNSSQASGEYIETIWKETDHAGQSATVAAPKLMGFGEEAEKAGKKAKKGADDVKRWNDEVQKATEKAGLSTFALHRWGGITVPAASSAIGDNREELLAWIPALDAATDETSDLAARVEDLQRAGRFSAAALVELNNQVSIMPERMQTAAEAYRSELALSAGSTDGFFERLRGWVSNVPKFFGDMQAGLTSKLSSLFGAQPDSALSSVIGGGLNFVFGPGAGLATKLMQQGLEALGGVVWKGLKKIAGFFRDIFGGPSADELAGREIVSAFESNLSEMLTDQQRLEAGGEAWKETVIALRDKYIELGLTEQDALRDAERLWASSREGAEASRRIVAEIERRLRGGITVPVSFDLPDGAGTVPLIPMARGGMGRVTRPTLFLAGEQGPEDFAFSGANSILQTGGGSTRIENVILLDGHEVHRSEREYAGFDLRRRQKMEAV